MNQIHEPDGMEQNPEDVLLQVKEDLNKEIRSAQRQLLNFKNEGANIPDEDIELLNELTGFVNRQQEVNSIELIRHVRELIKGVTRRTLRFRATRALRANARRPPNWNGVLVHDAPGPRGAAIPGVNEQLMARLAREDRDARRAMNMDANEEQQPEIRQLEIERRDIARIGAPLNPIRVAEGQLAMPPGGVALIRYRFNVIREDDVIRENAAQPMDQEEEEEADNDEEEGIPEGGNEDVEPEDRPNQFEISEIRKFLRGIRLIIDLERVNGENDAEVRELYNTLGALENEVDALINRREMERARRLRDIILWIANHEHLLDGRVFEPPREGDVHPRRPILIREPVIEAPAELANYQRVQARIDARAIELAGERARIMANQHPLFQLPVGAAVAPVAHVPLAERLALFVPVDRIAPAAPAAAVAPEAPPPRAPLVNLLNPRAPPGPRPPLPPNLPEGALGLGVVPYAPLENIQQVAINFRRRLGDDHPQIREEEGFFQNIRRVVEAIHGIEAGAVFDVGNDVDEQERILRNPARRVQQVAPAPVPVEAPAPNRANAPENPNNQPNQVRPELLERRVRPAPEEPARQAPAPDNNGQAANPEDEVYIERIRQYFQELDQEERRNALAQRRLVVPLQLPRHVIPANGGRMAFGDIAVIGPNVLVEPVLLENPGDAAQQIRDVIVQRVQHIAQGRAIGPPRKKDKKFPESEELILPRPGWNNARRWSEADVIFWIEKIIKNRDHVEMLRKKQFNGHKLYFLLKSSYTWREEGIPFGVYIQMKSHMNRVVNNYLGYAYTPDEQ